MRKIPTLFVRDEAKRAKVTDRVTPGCEWVLAGEGVPTRKYDGTCVMFDGALWWARREVKPGKTPPAGFVPLGTDDVTGKTVGWEPMAQSGWSRWHAEVLSGQNWDRGWKPGTYELCGPRVNGNPERLDRHDLLPHAAATSPPAMWTVERSWTVPEVVDLVRSVGGWGWEGIVWHHPDGRMAKLKAMDL